MNYCNFFATVTLALLISSCGTHSSSNADALSYLNTQVAKSVSQDAVNCGIVSKGDSQLQTNICIAESFANGLEFYAPYQLENEDYDEADAVSDEYNGMIYFSTYIGHPGRLAQYRFLRLQNQTFTANRLSDCTFQKNLHRSSNGRGFA